MITNAERVWLDRMVAQAVIKTYGPWFEPGLPRWSETASVLDLMRRAQEVLQTTWHGPQSDAPPSALPE